MSVCRLNSLSAVVAAWPAWVPSNRVALARSLCSSCARPAASEDRPERVRARSALLASPMLLTSPLTPTTTVAEIGTIIIRPNLEQIGRSRRRPTGTRRRDDSVVGVVVCLLLTSPPSEPAPQGKQAPATGRPYRAGPPRF